MLESGEICAIAEGMEAASALLLAIGTAAATPIAVNAKNIFCMLSSCSERA
jgi:hypothetical protein